MADKPEKLGALWAKTSARGDYFTGEVNGVKVVIFPNGYKDDDKKPDFIVYKSQPRS